MKSNYKNIFTPLTIKNMTMRNRIMMTPMGTNYGEQTGEMSFLHIDYYTERAKGGVGLIMVENASVDSPLGSNGTTQIRIDHDNYMPRFFKLCETLHAHGACVGVQLNHAGASAQSKRTNMQPVSASDIPSKAGGEIPRPLKVEEIYEYLPFVHLVLIMTVEPGEGGQKLLPNTIQKIKEIKNNIGNCYQKK